MGVLPFHVNTGDLNQADGDKETNFGSADSKSGAQGLHSLTAGINAFAGAEKAEGDHQYAYASVDKTFLEKPAFIKEFNEDLYVRLEGEKDFKPYKDLSEENKGKIETTYIRQDTAFKKSDGTFVHPKGAYTMAIGYDARAVNDQASAIGYEANAIGARSAAFGNQTTAIGQDSMAFGMNTLTIGDYSMAVGRSSIATETAKNSLVIGNESIVRGAKSLAIGNEAYAGKKDVAYIAVPLENISESELNKMLPNKGLFVKVNNEFVPYDKGNSSHKGLKKYARVNNNGTTAGNFTMAIGYGAEALTDGSAALGFETTALGKESAAIGYGATSTGVQSIALGVDALSSGETSIAIGNMSGTAKDAISSVAMGNSSLAKGVKSMALGFDSEAVGEQAAAIGASSEAIGKSAIAFGDTAKAKAEGSVSIGASSNVDKSNNIVENGKYSVAIGSKTQSKGENSLAMGVDAHSEGPASVALGQLTEAKAANTVALGNTAVADGGESISIGYKAKSSVGGAVALGSEANSAFWHSVAIGTKASATNSAALAAGKNTNASGAFSIAIGGGDNAGEGAKATQSYGVALGSKSEATGIQSTAIANGAKATGGNSLALGTDAKAGGAGNANNTTAIGVGAEATHQDGIALGSWSQTKEAKKVSSATVGSVTYNGFAGTAPESVVSVGKKGTERQIVNVAAGEISSTSTDAINGSQLYAVANKPITFDGDSGTTERKLGQKLQILGTTDEIVTAATEGKITVSLAEKAKEKFEQDYSLVADSSGSYKVSNDGNVTLKVQDASDASKTRDVVISNVASKTDLDTKMSSWNLKVNEGEAYTVNNDNNTVQFVDGNNIDITRENGKVTIAVTEGNIAAGDKGLVSGEKVFNETRVTKDNYNYINKSNTAAANLEALDGAIKTTETNLVDKGLKFGANSGDVNPVTNKLGTTVKVLGSGKEVDGKYDSSNIKTRVKKTGDDTEIEVMLSKELALDKVVVGEKGADGKPGKPGSIGINGKDGKSAEITVAKGQDGVNGTNGKDGITRIVYDNHEVATMEDGLKFQGDAGDVVKKQLNQTLHITGGEKLATNLTDNNIGITNDEQKGLVVKLAKDIDLGKEGSLTIAGNKYIGKDGINAGSKYITNVKSSIAEEAGGKYSEKLEAAKTNNPNNAVNVSDLHGVADEINKKIDTKTFGLVVGGKKAKRTLGNEIGVLGDDNLTVAIVGETEGAANLKLSVNKGKLVENIYNDTNLVNKIEGKTKISYTSNGGDPKKEVSLADGFNFKQVDDVTTVTAGANGEVTFGLDEKITNKIDGAIQGLTNDDKTVTLNPTTGKGESIDLAVNIDNATIKKVAKGQKDEGQLYVDAEVVSNNIFNDPKVIKNTTIHNDFIDKIENQTKIAYRANSDEKQHVTLEKGFQFKNGTYTTATAEADGAITIDINPTKAAEFTAKSREVVKANPEKGGYITVTPDGTGPDNLVYRVGFDKTKLEGEFDKKYIQKWTAKANGNEAAVIGNDGTLNFVNGDNILVTKDGSAVNAGKITIATSMTPTFTSVKAGDSFMNTDGITITGGPVITKTNINMGGQQIHNVKKGGTGTDAVNVDQLKAAIDAINTEIGGVTTQVISNQVVVYTTTDGDIVLPVTDEHGNISYYKKDDLDALSKPKDGAIAIPENTLETRVVNPEHENTKSEMILGNVGSSIDKHIKAADDKQTEDANKIIKPDMTPEQEAQAKVKYLLGDNLTANPASNKKVVNVKDLKDVAMAGLDFVGNDETNVHKNIGETVSILGEGVDKAGAAPENFKSASGNIAVVADSTNGLVVKLNQDLENINSISHKDGAKITLNGDKISLSGDNNTTIQIKGVAAGTDDTDAVNKKQLDDLTITYKANTVANDKDGNKVEPVKLSDGFDFTNGAHTTAEIAKDGVVKFNVKEGSISNEAAGNELVTGKTVFTEVRVSGINDKGETISYNVIDSKNTAAKNIEALDTAVGNKLDKGSIKKIKGAGLAKVAQEDLTAGDVTVNVDPLEVKKAAQEGLAKGTNIELTKDKSTGVTTIATAKDVTFDKVTVGNIVVDKNTGINAGKKEITNVKSAIKDIPLDPSIESPTFQDRVIAANKNALTKESAVNVSDLYSTAVEINKNVNEKTFGVKVNAGKDTEGKLTFDTATRVVDDQLEVKGDGNITVSIDGKDDPTKAALKLGVNKTKLVENIYNDKTLVEKIEGATSIKYHANSKNEQTVSLAKGLDFTDGTHTTAEVAKDGVVKFHVKEGSISNEAAGNELVTGKSVFTEVRVPTLAANPDGTEGSYNAIKSTYTTSQNLVELDKATKANKDAYEGIGVIKVAGDAGLKIDTTSNGSLKGHDVTITLNKDEVGNIAAAKFKNGTNITFTEDGTSGVTTIATAKDVTFDKVTLGNIVLDKNTGINAGDLGITNVKSAIDGQLSGQTDKTFVDKLAAAQGDTKTATNAVNVSDLHSVVNEINTNIDAKTFGVKVKEKGVEKTATRALSSTLDVIDDGNVIVSIEGDKAETNKLKIALDDEIKVGKAGKDGKDGVIGVNGKDGSSVVISGKDGITITGPKGEDGKDGISSTITIAKGTDGIDGTNGKDGITRIVYDKHEVATMEDGLKFGANIGKVNPVANKLGSTVTITGKQITGEVFNKDQYSSDNVRTVITQDKAGNTNVEIMLDKDLTANTVTVGEKGEKGDAGKPGTPGSVTIIGEKGTNGVDGKPGTNGKDGENAVAEIKVVNGKDGIAGVDGKNGITRIEYKDEGGDDHTIATLEDGLKFVGDDGTVISKKLNTTLGITGGIQTIYETEEDGSFKLDTEGNKIVKTSIADQVTDGNIAVVNEAVKDKDGNVIDNKLVVKLAKDLKGLDSVAVADSVTVGGEKGINISSVTTGAGTEAEKTTSEISGLTNTTFDENTTGKNGRENIAATEGQLKDIASTINGNIDGKTFGVKVKTGENPDGTDKFATATRKLSDQVEVIGDGNVIVSIDGDKAETNKLKIALDDEIKVGTVGKDGKDGKDGAIGVNGKDGKSSVAINGKDGISIKGNDGKDGSKGKDGVSIFVEGADGANGKDGVEGHIGLTGRPGKDGKDTTADIIVKNGQNGVDGTDGNNGTDGMTRIVYEDKNGKDHEVATLDDGLKFGANSGVKNPVANKLGSTVTITGKQITGEVFDENQYSSDNVRTVVTQDAAGNTNVEIMLDKDLTANTVTVGEKGEPGVEGKPGKAGSVTIIGEKGTNGKDGQPGTNGKDGKNAIAEIKVVNGKDGIAGVDGKNGITRIEYKDEGGDDHTIATLDDGLKFVGDDGAVIAKKLNTTLSVVGGIQEIPADPVAGTDKITIAEQVTDGNIGVVNEAVKDKDGKVIDNKLVVKLAKDLKGLETIAVADSVTVGEKGINISSVTTGAGTKDEKTTREISGLTNTTFVKDVTGEGDRANIAATEGQLKDIASTINGNIDGKTFGVKVKTGVDSATGKDIFATATRKVNNTLDVTDDGNIKVSIDGTDPETAKLKVALEDVITLGTDAGKKVVIDGTAGTANIGGILAGNQTPVFNDKDSTKDDEGNYVTGLDNTDWKADGTYVSGRAATEDQLKAVEDKIQHIDFDNLDIKGVVKYEKTNGEVNYGKITLEGGKDGTTITNIKSSVENITIADNANPTYVEKLAEAAKDHGTDAVNVSDLNNVSSELAGDITNLDNKLTNNYYDKGHIDSLALNYQVEDGAKKSVSLKDGTLKFIDDGNLVASYGENGEIKYGLSDDLLKKINNIHNDGDTVVTNEYIYYKANGGATEKVKLTDGLNFTDGTYTTAEIKADGVVTIDVNETKLNDKIEEVVNDHTVVDAGKVDLEAGNNITMDRTVENIDGKDVVTGITVNVDSDLKNMNSIANGKDGVGAKITLNAEKNVVNFNNGAKEDGDAKLTGVAAGEISENSTDAINGSQLYHFKSNVNNMFQDLNTNLNKLNRHVDKMDKNLRAGVAGATAMSFLQMPHMAGKSLISAAVGGYKGEQAVGVGYSRISDNGKVTVKFGAAVNSRNDVNYGASVGYQW